MPRRARPRRARHRRRDGGAERRQPNVPPAAVHKVGAALVAVVRRADALHVQHGGAVGFDAIARRRQRHASHSDQNFGAAELAQQRCATRRKLRYARGRRICSCRRCCSSSLVIMPTTWKRTGAACVDSIAFAAGGDRASAPSCRTRRFAHRSQALARLSQPPRAPSAASATPPANFPSPRCPSRRSSSRSPRSSAQDRAAAGDPRLGSARRARAPRLSGLAAGVVRAAPPPPTTRSRCAARITTPPRRRTACVYMLLLLGARGAFMVDRKFNLYRLPATMRSTSTGRAAPGAAAGAAAPPSAARSSTASSSRTAINQRKRPTARSSGGCATSCTTRRACAGAR